MKKLYKGQSQKERRQIIKAFFAQDKFYRYRITNSLKAKSIVYKNKIDKKYQKISIDMFIKECKEFLNEN